MNIQDSPSSKLTLDLMSASAERARVLAHNIANQNVPGYKRHDVVFEQLLAKAYERRDPDLESVEAQLVVDDETPSRADGNNVNLELERTKQEENAIMFELYATLMRGQMGLLRNAISGRRS